MNGQAGFAAIPRLPYKSQGARDDLGEAWQAGVTESRKGLAIIFYAKKYFFLDKLIVGL